MRPLRVSAGWVLPGSGEPIADGAVLVGGTGRIEAVGAERAVPRPRGAVRFELADAALLPGLVNAHTHLELTALGGLVRDLPFFDWIQTIRAIKEGLGDADYRAAARWGVLEAFAAGITTCGDTGSTGQAAAALDALGARGVAYHEVFGPDPAAAADAAAAAARALAALDAHRSERVAVGVSPHAPYTVSEPLLEALTRLAAEGHGRPTAMHVAESLEEEDLVARGGGPFAAHLAARGIGTAPRARSTVAWLERCGYLARRPLLIHCVTVDADDVAAIARRRAAVAHCPWSNALLHRTRADLARLRRAGVTVGLGTDSVAAGNRCDLFAEARLAALGAPLSARELLRLMTAGGAAALGIEGAGVLEPGAWGDLTAVSLGGAAFAGLGGGPEAAVAWGAGASDVVFTAVAGRVVWERKGRTGRWPGVQAGRERAAFRRAAARAHARSREAGGRDILGGVPAPSQR